MHAYQKDFIDFALQQQVLRFGEFTLKSGRISPYFFNAGLFNTGEALNRLGSCYAAAIQQSGIEFDLLFGPAYKGILLAGATASALAAQYGKPTPFAYNRKEVKDHGEGGQLVGADLQGKKVLLIDDVITAGTAIREVFPLLQAAGATLGGIVLALDRQEKGQNQLSAIEEIERSFQIPVFSIIRLDDILQYLQQNPELTQQAQAIEAYRTLYGVQSRST